MVVSFCELLEHHLGDTLDERGRQYLDFAIDGATRMRARMQGLLAYSRVESRARPRVPVESLAMMKAACERLPEDGLRSDRIALPTEAPRIFADPEQITRVLAALFDNALRFSEGPALVECTVDANDDHTLFRVQDRGVGIEPAHHERIFQVFQHLQDSRTYRGLGLGLAIAKRIVDRHGGTIGVDSELGRGATFWFTIPNA